MLLPLKKSFLLLTLIFALQACGFSPVYKIDNNIRHDLAGITIKNIGNNKMAQDYSNSLQDALNPMGDKVKPKYELSVNIKKRREAFIIEKNREITRYNLVLTAKYELFDAATGKRVTSGSSRTEGSYDAVKSDFATFAVEEDTLQRIIKESAKDLQVRLITFLK